MNDANLRLKLTSLKAKAARISSEGDVLTDAKIDSSIPGGSTVSVNPATYYRLRVKGQKLRYLEADRVAKMWVAIGCGEGCLEAIEWAE